MNVLRPERFEDPHAYWALVGEAWRAGEPFVIIETGVQAGPEVVARFESCPEPWCFNSYPVPADAHSFEAVDATCRVCSRLEHDHPSEPAPNHLDHPFGAVNAACAYCGLPEHAPQVGVQIADLGGFALGCSRFRPADLPAVFAYELLAGPVHWANLDVHVTTALRLGGVPAAHRHLPNVGHGSR